MLDLVATQINTEFFDFFIVEVGGVLNDVSTSHDRTFRITLKFGSMDNFPWAIEQKSQF